MLSCGFIASTTLVEPIQDSASKLSLVPNIGKPIFASSASVLSQNSSADPSNSIIRCDGETYGYNPNILDCEEAKEYLVPDEVIWTFGERHTGFPGVTIPLPYRIMGDHGLCYIQAVLIGDHKTAKANLNMLRRAAASLVVQCTTSAISQGGIATNIGKSEAGSIKWSCAGPHTDLHLMADTFRW